MKLMLVDFTNRVVGIEDTVGSGINFWIHTNTEFAKPGEFRCVTDTLAKAGEGWNPDRFCGGLLTGSVIGLLAVVEAMVKEWIWSSHIGKTIQLGRSQYVIRPCEADLMPVRLYQRYQAEWRRRHSRSPFGLREARRLCFGARNNPAPSRVFFAKGTTSVETPRGAVARIGGSESSTIIFVDKFARPIVAYKAAGSWDFHYAQEIPIPNKLNWRELRPLGKSSTDALFGVHG